MKKRVVISGGSGMIGKALSKLLLKEGYEVAHISRSKKNSLKEVKVISWNIEKQQLSVEEMEAFDCIIHLAGANVFYTPWTEKGKKEILNSRIASAKLLYDTVAKLQKKPKAIISASAVGYYGMHTSKHIFTEEDAAGTDFLAKCCLQWEKQIERFSSLGLRTLKLRKGIVISSQNKILKLLKFMVKVGLGAVIGKGNQYMSWIHIKDVCNIYLHCMQNQDIQGSYNAVAGNPTNAEFIKSMAKACQRPLWLPNIPAFIIKLILGKKANLALKGSKISSEKIKESGYVFKCTSLVETLKEL